MNLNMQQIRGSTIQGPMVSAEHLSSLRSQLGYESTDMVTLGKVSAGFHNGMASLSATAHSLLDHKKKHRKANRRCSEPAVKSPPKPRGGGGGGLLRGPHGLQQQQSPSGRFFFKRSLSSPRLDVLQGEVGETHVSWDMASVPTSSQAEASNAPSFSSKNLLSRDNKQTTSSTRSSSRSSSASSLDLGEDVDGFGEVVKSPLASSIHSKSRHSTTSSTVSRSRRRNRNHVDASDRLSNSEFLPVEPIFGDFAPPGSPATNTNFHASLPASGSWGNPLGRYDSESEDELLDVPTKPSSRMWDSLPELTTPTKTKPATEEKKAKESRTKHHESTSTNTTKKSKSKNTRRRQTMPTITSFDGNNDDNREESHFHASSTTMSTSLLTPDESDPLEGSQSKPPKSPLDTESSHSYTPTTASYASKLPKAPQEDLFLVEMENFRAQVASQLESKERFKHLKKESFRRKKSKKTAELTTATTTASIEFNVEDQSIHFRHYSGDSDTEPEPALQHQSQPREIKWSPPGHLEATRMARRYSMPTTLQDYEPAIPNFTALPTRRKPTQVKGEPPLFVTIGGDQRSVKDSSTTTMNKTTTSASAAGESMLHLEYGDMGDRSVRDSDPNQLLDDNEEGEDASEMNPSGKKRISSHSTKRRKSRLPSGQHSSEQHPQKPSSRRSTTSKLDKSGGSKSQLRLLQGETSSRVGKPKRRGSTSVVELTSSSTAAESGKSRRREGSMPPSSGRGAETRSGPSKTTQRTRPSSSKPVLDSSITTSVRSSKGKSSKPGTRRISTDPLSSSSSRRESSKPPSRRNTTSLSPGPGDRLHATKSSTDAKASKRSGAKSGTKRSSHKRISSLPPRASGEADAGEKKKSTTKASTRHSSGMSQSERITSSERVLRKKSSRRSTSCDRTRQEGSGSSLDAKAAGALPKKSKPGPQKAKRRSTLSTMNAATGLDSHISCPKIPSSSQGSQSGITLSTTKSDEPTANRNKKSPPKRGFSWSPAEFDLVG